MPMTFFVNGVAMKAMLFAVLLVFAFSAFAAFAHSPGKHVHTLYRNSPVDEFMRIHIATFDADEDSATYNAENCQIAAQLFQRQPGVTAKYWCEKGRYER